MRMHQALFKTHLHPYTYSPTSTKLLFGGNRQVRWSLPLGNIIWRTPIVARSRSGSLIENGTSGISFTYSRFVSNMQRTQPLHSRTLKMRSLFHVLSKIYPEVYIFTGMQQFVNQLIIINKLFHSCLLSNIHKHVKRIIKCCMKRITMVMIF